MRCCGWLRVKTSAKLVLITKPKKTMYILGRGAPWAQRPIKRESRAMMANAGNETGPLQEEYIRKAKLARRLGKPVRTIEYWMWRGWLTYHKVGRSVRFLWSEINATLAERYHVA